MRTTVANPDDMVGTSSTQTNDLWLVYSPISNRQAFVNALCALYYLPEQYKLIVSDAIADEMPEEHRDLMSRIHITEETEKKMELSEQATPFAFIYGDEDQIASPRTSKKAPTVIVTDQPEQYVKDNEWDGFTVPTGVPEALASAILNIARTSLYNGLRLVKQPLTS
jgi:hypothetical protein